MNWDNIWRDKKYITDFSLRWQGFLFEVSAMLAEDAKILEAGCGSGEGLAVFTGPGRTLVGLDISEEAIRRTSQYPQIRAIKGDNFALPFPKDAFDLVFNSGVIEHYKYPDNIRQIKEMARVAKPGGLVIINVPNSLCIWYIAIKNILLSVRRWQFGYEESYSPMRLREAVQEAGLNVIKETGFLAIPPFGTERIEFLPVGLRKKIASVERRLPLKQYYCYSVCVICRKE